MFADQNDINEDTRIQLDLINEAPRLNFKPKK